jgi:RNA polymerase sigma factor (sigma-70 family)
MKDKKIEDLIKQFKPKIRYIASKLNASETDVLTEAGIVGLLDAYLSFDESRNINFSTFAYHRIYGAIIDEIRRNSWFNPRSKKLFKMYYIEEIDPSMFDGTISIEEAIIKRDENKKVKEAVEQLPVLQRAVINLVYWYNYSIRDIAKIMDLSENRISQIHKEAKDTLKEVLK